MTAAAAPGSALEVAAKVHCKVAHRPHETLALCLSSPPCFQFRIVNVCGRYRLSRRKEVLAEYFGADFSEMDWQPRYNVAPTQAVPVLRRDPQGALRASQMRWGLIPSWARRSFC